MSYIGLNRFSCTAFHISQRFSPLLTAAVLIRSLLGSWVLVIIIIGVVSLAAFLFSLTTSDGGSVAAAAAAAASFSPHRIVNPIPAPADKDRRDGDLHYAVAVDCGSSGSRIFVYAWPPQSQQADLLHIRELKGCVKDRRREIAAFDNATLSCLCLLNENSRCRLPVLTTEPPSSTPPLPSPPLPSPPRSQDPTTSLS